MASRSVGRNVTFDLGKHYRVKPNCKVEGEFSNKNKRLPVPSNYLLLCIALNNNRVIFIVNRKDKRGKWKVFRSRKMMVKVTLNTNQAQFLEEVGIE